LTIFSFSFFFFFYIHNTKYKFKTNKQKLHENYNKSPKTIWNLQGTTSAPPEQCQADFQSGKTVAARLLHAPPQKKPAAGGDPKQLPPFFFPGRR
jgi:hypothetical protein